MVRRQARTVLTNVNVRLETEKPSPDGPDDPFDLVGPRSVVAERLRYLKTLGFDDMVLVSARHDAPPLQAPRARVTPDPPGRSY